MPLNSELVFHSVFHCVFHCAPEEAAGCSCMAPDPPLHLPLTSIQRRKLEQEEPSLRPATVKPPPPAIAAFGIAAAAAAAGH